MENHSCKVWKQTRLLFTCMLILPINALVQTCHPICVCDMIKIWLSGDMSFMNALAFVSNKIILCVKIKINVNLSMTMYCSLEKTHTVYTQIFKYSKLETSSCTNLVSQEEQSSKHRLNQWKHSCCVLLLVCQGHK